MNIFSRAVASIGSLWRWSRLKRPSPDHSPEVVDGWIRIYSGGELLRRSEVAPLVQKVTANFRGTPTQQYKMLNTPLRAFASMVQLLPASEYYHHFERGGLLSHQLECMLMAMTAQYQIHQLVDSRLVRDNVPPDFTFWTNYCFHLRALTHDIGKLQTLFNIYLLVARGKNSYDEIPYDPMDGGFGANSLFARAEQEKAKGARWVRYRYTFKRGAPLQQHERYWEVGIARVLRHLSDPIPGKHYAMHLTDSESFRTYLAPKLEEIDRRSVVNFQTRADRAASPEQILYRHVLEELVMHPQFRSAELVQAQDGRQIIFLPFSVMQVFLNELPHTDLFSTVPRHPDQCFRKLKGAGYSTRFGRSATDKRQLEEYNGRAGIFLDADITSAMLGASFLRASAENVSARLGDLFDARSQSAADSSRSALPPVGPPSAHNGAMHDGAQLLRPVSEAPRPSAKSQFALDAATTATLSSTPPVDTMPPIELPVEPKAAKPPKGVSTLASPKSPSPDILEKLPASPDSPAALPRAIALLLESMTPEDLLCSRDVTLEGNSLVFSSRRTQILFNTASQTARLSARHFRHFAENSAVHCPEKWAMIGGKIVCTAKYTRRLLGDSKTEDALGNGGRIDFPPTPPDLSLQSSSELVGSSWAKPEFQDQESPESPRPLQHPVSRTKPKAAVAAALHSAPQGPDAELAALLASVRAIYAQTGERFLTSDGQLAKLDFRAVDQYTGHKQRRGRVLEMLRHLRIYVSHRKNAEIVIQAHHPEIQACLADLQRGRQ